MITKRMLTASVAVSLLISGENVQAQDSIQVSFTITNAGIDVQGTIEGIESDIRFDPDDLSGSSIKAWAKTSTIKTGIGIRDRHLKNSDYFNSMKHPLITLQSRGFRRSGRQKFFGDFDLTIKDVTKPVTLVFSRTDEGKTLRYKGHFEMNRLEFGLGEESVVLGKTVKVTIEVSVKK
jgi:polyisoprenoid-binding protein YceI